MAPPFPFFFVPSSYPLKHSSAMASPETALRAAGRNGWPPVIRTARLTLRAPAAGDIDAIVQGIGDFDVARMLARVPHPYTRADAERFVTFADAEHAAGTSLHLMIDGGGAVVGGLGLHGRPPVPSEFGYWLRRSHWGQGLATEAARAFLTFAFETLGCERIPSGVFAGNVASLRVQDKLGFIVVGEGSGFCQARGETLRRIETLLTRARYREVAA